MGKLLRRVSYWLRRTRMEAELAEEMEFHRAMLGEDAGRHFGNHTLAREDARWVWIWPWLESFYRDFRYGLRALGREPGFTLLALAALGSGIGLNVSLYTGFTALALRPWAVPDPASVVSISGGWSIAEARYLSEQSRSLAGVIAMRNQMLNLGGQPMRALYVTGNYFRVLGVQPQLGRGFRDDEDSPTDPQAVVVISDTAWKNRFASDPAIIGKTVRLDEIPFTVVGVAPRNFAGTEIARMDAWLPFATMLLLRPNDPGARPFLSSAEHCCSDMAGRIHPGITRDQARAEAELLLNRFRSENRLKPVRVELRGTAWLQRADRKARQALPVVGMMFLGTLMVLLLACANVGNLLLARAAARAREIAIRLSLGGSRIRLIRQLLVESLTLALSASAVGLLIAVVLPDFVIARLSHSEAVSIGPDVSALGCSVFLAVMACAAFGLAPALAATRADMARARPSMRGVLLSAQVALSIVLLAAAGMLARAVGRIGKADLGFRYQGVSVVSLDLPASAYAGPRLPAFVRQLTADVERASRLPRLAFVNTAPLGNSRNMRPFRLLGQDDRADRPIVFHTVTSGYFDVLGIQMVGGRTFTALDDGRAVALVNEALASHYWPHESPLGKMVISGKPLEIIGIVKNSSTEDLVPAAFLLYLPMNLFPEASLPVILARGDGAAAAQQIGAIAKQIEPRAEAHWQPLERNLRRALEPGIAGAVIAGGMGALALTLGVIGISGMFAYMVRQRTREIGIRVALGARPNDVLRLVLGSCSRAIVWGMAAGLAGAAAAARLLRNLFDQVSASDPAPYAGVAVILMFAALIAGVAPARRAARVDPAKALRWE